MIKNYFKIAFRNFKRNKIFSVINVSGLAIGMAVSILIGLWIWDEFSFDKYYSNHKKLAVVMSTQTWNGETATDESAAVPLADELRRKHSDDLKKVVLISEITSHILSIGEKQISGDGMWTQHEFPDMFTLKKIKGNLVTLRDPSYLLLSASMANALFGNNDPINKTIQIDARFNLKVGGVYEDFPQNSRFFGTNLLLPWNSQENANNRETGWSNHHFQVFVEINDKSDFSKITAKIKDISKPYIKTKSNEEMMLQPLDKAYLYNEFKNGKASGGRILFVRLFAIIDIFVLLLACINFMNLSTAKSQKRSKEVGMRKVMGSIRRQLIFQFLCESLLLTLLAFILSIVLVYVSLPFFNELSGKQLTIQWSNPVFWILILCFTIFTALISGSYPAFYLSAFEPIRVLKGAFQSGRQGSWLRKSLVVLQFSVSIGLIIGTIVVFRQIEFAKSRPTQYSRDGLITIEMTTPEISGHYNALRDDLLQTGAVENMAESSSPSTNVRNSIISFDWRGKDPKTAPLMGLIGITHDFGKTIGWAIKEGRDFSRDFPTDSSNNGAFILNEAAVRLTGLQHPVGDKIKLGDKEHIITGVIKDMVMESPFKSAQPTVFWLNYEWRISYISLRIKPAVSVHKALDKIAGVFRKYSPATPFEYQFVDEEYARKFLAEESIGNLATLFSIFAIFISCLGLFGLASFVAEQRTKEIGLRKVLGASVFNLWRLLSKDFVLLVIISCAIAIPVAYYFLNDWLQGYEYRTKISLWVFVAAASGALVITLLTVSFQSIKAALANPVKSLRTE